MDKTRMWPLFGEVLEDYFGQEESWEMGNGEMYETTTLEHMDNAEFIYGEGNVYKFKIGLDGYTYTHQIKKEIIPKITEEEFKDEIKFACEKVKREAKNNE